MKCQNCGRNEATYYYKSIKRMKFENVKIMNINDVSSLEQVIKEVKENG